MLEVTNTRPTPKPKERTGYPMAGVLNEAVNTNLLKTPTAPPVHDVERGQVQEMDMDFTETPGPRCPRPLVCYYLKANPISIPSKYVVHGLGRATSPYTCRTINHINIYIYAPFV